MRKWYKYYFEINDRKIKKITKFKRFEEFEKAMGGYSSNQHYESRDKFNKEYLKDRFSIYAYYLKSNLKKNKNILSIASGRCINELNLLDKGYKIICTDLSIPQCYKKSKKIFKKFNYYKFDILKDNLKKKYDTIIGLGLLYVFSEKQLNKFFKRLNKLVKLNGEIIVDSSSSPDNIITYLYDNLLLKFENKILSLILNIIGKKNNFISRHHGYKFKNKELIKIAKQHGFEIIDVKTKDFVTEFSRSRLISKIYILNLILKPISFFMSYVRIFKFKKIENL